MKKVIASGLLAVCAAGTVLSGSAMAAKAASEKHAEAAVEYRQSLFQLVKSNAAPMFGMLKMEKFDPAVMKTNGMRLEQLADMMADYLLVDTTEFDVPTDAKPALFSNEADAKDKIAALKKVAMDIQAASGSGDESAYAKAIAGLGGTCKSCHDDYKE
ncbi:c-type cytochrome [Alteromonas sp. AMM-1]|uniref:c-type cytochrome n=1 Tax=Alteromonas sp. AMM-1 TaxID=3394233 RepID=UPI0039A4C90F